MRTIENVVNDLKFHVELPNSPEKYRILKLFDEILEIHRTEKEQIIKAFEDERVDYEEFDYISIDEAIEIVKAGGKE